MPTFSQRTLEYASRFQLEIQDTQLKWYNETDCDNMDIIKGWQRLNRRNPLLSRRTRGKPKKIWNETVDKSDLHLNTSDAIIVVNEWKWRDGIVVTTNWQRLWVKCELHASAAGSREFILIKGRKTKCCSVVYLFLLAWCSCFHSPRKPKNPSSERLQLKVIGVLYIFVILLNFYYIIYFP